jgi:tripeptidyl-peptidase-1
LPGGQLTVRPQSPPLPSLLSLLVNWSGQASIMYSKAALVLAVLAQALPAFGAVHEKLAALPAGWTTAAAAPDASTIVSFTIGLAQQNIDQLQSKLLAVSTPGNAQYGQYLDADEVNSIFAPTAQTISAVESWLSAGGISSYKMTPDGQFINFATTVGTANSLLNTTFLSYKNSGVTKIRATQYSISPITYFGKTGANIPTFTRTTKTKKDVTTQAVSSNHACHTSITPHCIKKL